MEGTPPMSPLDILYRTLIDSHTLPSEWRLSIITPKFKKGSPSDPKNYRPIALTCSCCKILESIIASEVLTFLLEHKLITRDQHGFFKTALYNNQSSRIYKWLDHDNIKSQINHNCISWFQICFWLHFSFKINSQTFQLWHSRQSSFLDQSFSFQ